MRQHLARPRRSHLAMLAGALVTTALLFPVLTAGAAQALTCGDPTCGPDPPDPPPTQVYGQNLTAIVAFTNTGATCTFGFPVVTTRLDTATATWTASVQCTEQMGDISGKTVFDVWNFAGQSVACSNGICGGILPDFGAQSSLTLSGSTSLAHGVSYGVQSEIALTAPPGQSWVTSPIITNGTFFYCTPDNVGNTGFSCWLDTGPFSVP